MDIVQYAYAASDGLESASGDTVNAQVKLRGHL